ncbi:Nucleotide-binding universal stress protein, UspA family [Enhydrobacter aerosaccus]|uniref:Nucleotide-binding universal stress protein, UspA family n=1 Tax=Enhydrobacter aerosaccus TaxID=225324 RepID=A0A1T4SRY9_9HYPH|nr:universal stress protein [Enhydrobacter aerosaccus]SKA31005.1 Nucleotide-binding universal stress protein, UspA family [Enhydrobacter aerosaccus]
MHHILVATDGSEGAGRAMDVAAEMTKAMSGTLSILTVGGNASDEEMQQLRAAEGDLWGALDQASRQILRRAEERTRQLGVSPTRSLVAWGDPATAIIDAVRREAVDAIVIGRRGRGQLAGLLLGSVSQKIVTLAPCVVVVVP